MAKRKKSLNDIQAQFERIANALRPTAGNAVSDARFEKAYRAVTTYGNNIKATKSYNQSNERFNKALHDRDDRASAQKAIGIADKMLDRKYSRNTYMGNSKG